MPPLRNAKNMEIGNWGTVDLNPNPLCWIALLASLLRSRGQCYSPTHPTDAAAQAKNLSQTGPFTPLTGGVL